MKKPKSKSKNLWTVSSLLNKNFLVRTLSGVGLLVIVLGAVLWSPFSMLVLMAVLMAGSLTEFFRIARPIASISSMKTMQGAFSLA